MSTNIKHKNIQCTSFIKVGFLQSYCIGLHYILKVFILLCPPTVDASFLIETLCQPCTYTHSLTSTVYCSVFHNKQTQACTHMHTHTFLCWSFLEKCLNFPHSHFHKAPYLTVGRERNKQQRAASASLSDLKFIKYIKPGPAPSGNICNPKLCLLLLPPASSCHKHST